MRYNKKETSVNKTIEESTEQTAAENSRSLESSVDTSFFYTNDKFIDSFDNDEIIAKIQSKYSNINARNSDSVLKKNIVYFLDDEKFVEHILNYYNITVFDLFKLMYKQYSSIFKGPYLKKIRKTISNKKYAANRRKETDY